MDTLPLRRCTMLSMEMVRAVLGLNTKQVLKQVDSGALRWVWDISAKREGRGIRHVRELRFWHGTLDPKSASLEEAAVIDAILGSHRQSWKAADLCAVLLCSKMHITVLLQSRSLAACPTRPVTVNRESLRAFLQCRLVT